MQKFNLCARIQKQSQIITAYMNSRVPQTLLPKNLCQSVLWSLRLVHCNSKLLLSKKGIKSNNNFALYISLVLWYDILTFWALRLEKLSTRMAMMMLIPRRVMMTRKVRSNIVRASRTSKSASAPAGDRRGMLWWRNRHNIHNYSLFIQDIFKCIFAKHTQCLYFGLYTKNEDKISQNWQWMKK